MNSFRLLLSLVCLAVTSEAAKGQELPKDIIKHTSIRLPSPASAIYQGASGRLQFYRLPKLQLLAAFDTAQIKIVGYVPVPWQNALVAAGQDYLFVVEPESGTVHRWTLSDLKQDRVAVLSIKNIDAIGIGAASKGPLVVVEKYRRSGDARPVGMVYEPYLESDQLRFVEPDTLNETKFTIVNENKISESHDADRRVLLFVSDDGKTLMFPASGFIGQLKDKECAISRWPGIYSDRYPSMARPWTDGKKIFGCSSPLRLETRSVQYPENGTEKMLPAIEAAISVAGSDEELATFLLDPLMESRDYSRIAYSDRILFIPASSLVTYLQKLDSEIWCAKLDLGPLQNSAVILNVTSPLSLPVRPNQDFVYDLEFNSNQPDTTVSLEFGPKGFEVSKEGKMKWKVPRLSYDARFQALLSIRSGPHCRFHTFTFEPTPNPGQTLLRGPVEPAQPESSSVGADKYSVDDPLAIRTMPLHETRFNYQLPSRAERVEVGGGGRFLLIHLPSLGKLAVFDLNVAQIIGYIPVGAGSPIIATGGDAVFIGEKPASSEWATRIRRWSLKTLQPEKLYEPGDTNKTHIAGAMMGSASTTELFIDLWVDGTTRRELTIFDAVTLLPRPTPFDRRIFPWDKSSISPDGSIVFTRSEIPERRDEPADSSISTCLRKQPDWSIAFNTRSEGFIATNNPDFLVKYFGFASTRTGKTVCRIAETVRDVSSSDPRVQPYHIPSLTDNTILSWDREKLQLRTIGVAPVLATMITPAELIPNNKEQDHNILNRWSQRAWLVPAAEALVVMSPNRDYLALQRFSKRQIIAESGQKIRIVSSPNVVGYVGKPYECRILAESDAEVIRFELASGPDGMSISNDGVLQWSVPADWAADQQEVIVKLSSGGDSLEHPFTITFPELVKEEPIETDRRRSR